MSDILDMINEFGPINDAAALYNLQEKYNREYCDRLKEINHLYSETEQYYREKEALKDPHDQTYKRFHVFTKFDDFCFFLKQEVYVIVNKGFLDTFSARPREYSKVEKGYIVRIKKVCDEYGEYLDAAIAVRLFSDNSIVFVSAKNSVGVTLFTEHLMQTVKPDKLLFKKRECALCYDGINRLLKEKYNVFITDQTTCFINVDRIKICNVKYNACEEIKYTRKEKVDGDKYIVTDPCK